MGKLVYPKVDLHKTSPPPALPGAAALGKILCSGPVNQKHTQFFTIIRILSIFFPYITAPVPK